MHMRTGAVQVQAVDNPHKDNPEDDKILATCSPDHTPGRISRLYYPWPGTESPPVQIDGLMKMAAWAFRNGIPARRPCGFALVSSRLGQTLGGVLRVGVVASNRVGIAMMDVKGGFQVRGEPYLVQ